MSSLGGRPAKNPLVLRPYISEVSRGWGRFRRILLWAGMFFFCVLYGFFYGFFAQFLILQFTLPVLFLAAIVIWALPDSPTAPTAPLEVSLFAFFIVLIVWPNYLAVALPGLPWITFMRMTEVPLVLCLLVCTSTSAEFRSAKASALNAIPLQWKALTGFIVVQFLTIAGSKYVGLSIQKFIVAQLTWTAIFFASCYIFLKPKRIERWAFLLWGMAIFVSLIALREYSREELPWAGHIPSFLAIQDETVARILSGANRDGIYRAQSTFSTPLGLAEYLALTLPFVIHFMFKPYSLFIRVAAIGSAPFFIYVITLTDARLGIIGAFLSFLLYALFWGALRWRQHRSGFLGPVIVLSYPALVCAAFAATIFVGRIRERVWGSGQYEGSNEGRVEMYNKGIPMVLGHPWGYGPGTGAETLGITNPAGTLTIDTYYMLIALEYGIVGFVLYYGMLLLTISYSIRYAVKAWMLDREFAFLIPLSISLINYFVIKSVFSNDDNHPIVFMMMGMIAALVHRVAQKNQEADGRERSTGPRWFNKPATQPAKA